MELKIQNGESLDKRNTTDAKVLWGVNADGYLEMKRWLSIEGHKSTVCVLTQEGEGNQRHSLKQVTGRTAPSWKRAQKNGAQSPGKRQGSLLFFLVLWWKRPQWEILTLSLLKGRVWRLKIFTQGTEIPTLISDLWSHQSLHWHKGQPSL